MPQKHLRAAALLTFFSSLLGLFVTAGPVQAAPQLTAEPTFKVEMMRLELDRRFDVWGSDELALRVRDFSGRSYGQAIARTKLFQGMTGGETANIPSSQWCVGPTVAVVDKNGDGYLNGKVGDKWACRSHGLWDVKIGVDLVDEDVKVLTSHALIISRSELVDRKLQVGGSYQIRHRLCHAMVSDGLPCPSNGPGSGLAWMHAKVTRVT